MKLQLTPQFPVRITTDGNIEATFANGVLNLALVGNTSAAPFAAMADQNFIDNGAMEIAQLNGSNAVNVAAAADSYTFKRTVDRWIYENRGSMVVTLQQVADAPPGLSRSLKLSVVTPQAAMNAPDSCAIFQWIEWANFARAGFGASGALPITLFWWVKAHRPGQYGGTFKSSAAGLRVWGFHYRVNTADTWEYKTTTVQGDSAGTWNDGSANSGAYFMLSQATGATLGSCIDGGWGTQNGSNVPGSVNGIASASDTFQITGIGAVIGTQAPSQADSIKLLRPQHQELIRCQRYLRKDVPPDLHGSVVSSILAGRMSMRLDPEMRKVPTPYMVGNLGVAAGPNFDTTTTLGTNFSKTHMVQIHMNQTGAGGAGSPAVLQVGHAAQVYDVDAGASYLIIDADFFNELGAAGLGALGL